MHACIPLDGFILYIPTFFFFFGCSHGIWKFLGQGSNLSYSCDPHHSCCNARPLTHCAGLGIKPVLLPRQCQIPNLLCHNRNSLSQHYWTNSLLLDMQNMSNFLLDDVVVNILIHYTNFHLSSWDKCLELLSPVQTKDGKSLILEVCLLPFNICGLFLSTPYPFSIFSFNYGENILHYIVAVTDLAGLLWC